MGAIQARDLDFETEFIITLVSSVAEQVTSRTTDSPVLQRWADELSDVVCARLGIPPRGAALE
jgi:hypothetical protein